jgi:hypothetical protein
MGGLSTSRARDDSTVPREAQTDERGEWPVIGGQWSVVSGQWLVRTYSLLPVLLPERKPPRTFARSADQRRWGIPGSQSADFGTHR